MRVATYTRISTDEDHQPSDDELSSLRAQIDHALANGATPARSASAGSRP